MMQVIYGKEKIYNSVSIFELKKEQWDSYTDLIGINSPVCEKF